MQFRPIVLCIVLLAVTAAAQDAQHAPESSASEGDQSRIAPLTPLPDPAILTTKRPAEQPVTPEANANAPKRTMMGAQSPFGKPTMPIESSIPSGPHTAISTPVVDVDTIDASEPSEPTPVAEEENPAAQDPAEPTPLTSPLFDEKDDSHAPRRLSVRVLNKVTTQSQVFSPTPGETITFGRLQVKALGCRVSSPGSLSDSAGLFEISEPLPGNKETQDKPLFRGWMYASSPSISALEHPVYDVTMVSCDISTPPEKKVEKPAKKSEKKAKK